MNVLHREKLSTPIHLCPSDTLTVTWCPFGGETRTVAKYTMGKVITIVEIVVIETMFEGHPATGVLLVE